MTADNNRDIKLFPVLRECVICIITAAVLFTMDRCLENMYCFFLYDTGKRWLDIFMSAYLHAHRWFPLVISISFFIWLCIKKFKINYGLLIPISVVYILYLITSLLADGNISRWGNLTLFPATMYLFATMACSTEKGAKRFFRVGTDLYIFLLLLNALFTLFPQLYHLFTPWEPDYFLSADNLTGFPLFFGLFLAAMDHTFNEKKCRYILYLILFFINQGLIHCISSFAAAFIFLLFVAAAPVRDFIEKRHLFPLLCSSVILFLLLLTSAILFINNDKAYEFMCSILKYRESVAVRFIIWNGVLFLLLKKPLLGYGLGNQAEFFLRPPANSLYYNAHNAFLQTLYEGGLITQGAVGAVFFVLSKKIEKCDCSRYKGIVKIILFSELIMMQASITSWFTWYPVFLIAQISALCCSMKAGEQI